MFTEQGIAMLSALLRNQIAVQVSINIMDAFVEMRKFMLNNGQLFQEIGVMKEKLLEHDKKFDKVFDELQKNQQKEFEQKIFFDGQIFDAYSLIIDIIKSAKIKITIIDNKVLYHCGASFKDLGKKCFGINKIEGKDFIENINKIINF